MARDEAKIADAIKEFGLQALRCTPERVDSLIVDEHYYLVPGSHLTICVLTLANRFRVTGESSVVMADNYDPETSRRLARDKARDKIYEFEGYLMHQRQYEKEQADA